MRKARARRDQHECRDGCDRRSASGRSKKMRARGCGHRTFSRRSASAGRATNVAGEGTDVLHARLPKARAGVRLRVDVVIDQEIADASKSGLVRCWMQFLPELSRHADFDVTLHAVGAVTQTHRVAPHTRIIEHAPGAISTALLPRIGLEVPARTGLLPFHRGSRALRRPSSTCDTLLPFAWTSASRVAPRDSAASVAAHTRRCTPGCTHAQFARIAFATTPPRPGLGRARRLLAATPAERQQAWFVRRCAGSSSCRGRGTAHRRRRGAQSLRGVVSIHCYTDAARSRLATPAFGIPASRHRALCRSADAREDPQVIARPWRC